MRRHDSGLSAAEVDAEAARLVASGYRPVSRRHRMLSRIDREDWREWMGRDHTRGFPGPKDRNLAEGMRWVDGLGSQAADFYRRVHSKDVLHLVPQDVFDAVRRSGPDYGNGGREGYLPIAAAPAANQPCFRDGPPAAARSEACS